MHIHTLTLRHTPPFSQSAYTNSKPKITWNAFSVKPKRKNSQIKSKSLVSHIPNPSLESHHPQQTSWCMRTLRRGASCRGYQTRCVMQGVSGEVCHAGGIRRGVSCRGYQARCVMQRVSDEACHAGGIRRGVSRRGHQTRCVI